MGGASAQTRRSCTASPSRPARWRRRSRRQQGPLAPTFRSASSRPCRPEPLDPGHRAPRSAHRDHRTRPRRDLGASARTAATTTSRSTAVRQRPVRPERERPAGAGPRRSRSTRSRNTTSRPRTTTSTTRRRVGANINIVTKSGTNEFHGAVYYAYTERRDDRLAELTSEPALQGLRRQVDLRRHARRPDHQGQAVLLPRLRESDRRSRRAAYGLDRLRRATNESTSDPDDVRRIIGVARPTTA